MFRRSSRRGPAGCSTLIIRDPVTLKSASRGFDPRGAGRGLWVYRRIVDPASSEPGSYPGSSGIIADQLAAKRLLAGSARRQDVSPAEADRHVTRAKQLSLSLLYWLQTECPRPDGKVGWKGLRLRPDLMGTARWTGQGAVCPRIAAHPGRIHGHRATRRHRGSPPAGASAGCRSREICGQRRRW